MTEREPIGYLEKAALALEGTGDPKDTLGARIVRILLYARGADIFTYRSPKMTLSELESSPELSEQLNMVLSCFNTSPKTATFLHIGKSPFISEVRKWFRATYIKKEDPRLRNNYVNAYFDTLAQFGMLEELVEGEDELEITSKGNEIGEPIAAKMLSYEWENKQSLFPIFGQVSVKEKGSPRSPLTRAKILLGLKQRQHDSTTDLSTVHKDPRTIVESLINLQRAGMVEVTYERTLKSGSARQYKIADPSQRGEIRKIKNRRRSFAEMVATACEALAKDGKKITATAVEALIPKEYRDTHSESSLRTDVHHVLQAFARDIHFLEDVSTQKSFSIIEKAKLTPKGEKLVTELLLPLIDGLQGGTVIAEWRQLVPGVRHNLDTIAQETFAYYAPYTKGARGRDRETVKENIVAYLRQNTSFIVDAGGGYDVRAEDISTFTQLPEGSTESLLEELVAQGKLKRVYKKGYYVYKVPEAVGSEQ